MMTGLARNETRMIIRLPHPCSRPGAFALSALVTVLVLLVLAPFAAALQIDHTLAVADHDGHQHSTFDLCNWVQQHANYSIAPEVPMLKPLIRFLLPVRRVALLSSDSHSL